MKKFKGMVSLFEIFKATLSPMMVMFLCIIIGLVLNKKKLLPENAATVLSKLENFVLVPCLILNTFIKYCTVTSLKQQYKLIIYSIIAVLIAIALAYLLSPLFEKDSYKKNVYRYALTFGNFGFMGNAIVPQILGEEVLYEYLLFTLPFNLAVYTWGIIILTPKSEKSKNPLVNLLNPIVIAMALGIILGLLGIEKHMPDFVMTTIGNLSACMGPLAMVLTGFVIGDYNIPKLLTNKKVYIATLLRLFIFPALFIALLLLFGADNKVMTLALFAFATPLGMNTVVFPAAYGQDTSTGASMAMISHTLSVITIPIMYSLFTLII